MASSATRAECAAHVVEVRGRPEALRAAVLDERVEHLAIETSNDAFRQYARTPFGIAASNADWNVSHRVGP